MSESKNLEPQLINTIKASQCLPLIDSINKVVGVCGGVNHHHHHHHHEIYKIESECTSCYIGLD